MGGRGWTVEQKRVIVEEYESAPYGAKAAVLRRHGASDRQVGLIPFFRTVAFDVLRRFGVVFVVFVGDFGRGLVAESGVQPGAIVEDLDVFGNGPPGFRQGGKHGPVDQLVLQCGEKRLRHSVVPALPHRTHRATQV